MNVCRFPPSYWDESGPGTTSILGSADNLQKYIALGPAAVKAAIVKYGWCQGSWHFRYNPKNCVKGFTLLPSSAFNELPWKLVPGLLLGRAEDTGYWVDKFTGNSSYGLHLFNGLLKWRRIVLEPDRVITKILNNHCPVTCKYVGDEM
jgi:hypothetical protein